MKWYCILLSFSVGMEVVSAQPAGPLNSTNVFDGGGGQNPPVLWANPNLARTQDDAYATLVTSSNGQRTNYLRFQNFGFNIPAGSGIDGIVVEIDRYGTAPISGTVNDERIRIIDATGTIGSHDKSTGLSWPTSDADFYQSYGGITDKWLVTWTAAKINDPNFGVAVAARTSNSPAGTFSLFVDEVRITVYYTAGGSQRYAVASGLWNDPFSWATTAGGTAGVVPPTAAEDVFIGGGFTITQNVAGASCNSLTIGTTEATPTGNLTFNDNNRDIAIGPGGLVITTNGDVLSSFTPRLTTAGDFTLNKVLTNRDFEVRINGSGTEIISGTGSLGWLHVQTITTNTGNITVTDRLAGPALRLINGGAAFLTYTGTTAGMDTNVLDLTTTGNTVTFAQTLADATDFDIWKPSNTFYNLVISGDSPKYFGQNITINGNLTITATGILDNQDSHGITLHGNWSNNNGASGFVPNACNPCTVNFLGGNSQTITNASGENFYRIGVNKTAGTTVTAASNLILDDLLTMTEGILDIGSNSLTGAADVDFNGGELIIGTTGSTVPALSGIYDLNGGTITFNGAGAQTIRSSTSAPAITSYVNVQFLGSGTKSLSGAIAASGNLTIGGTATLDVTASNFAISLAGDWTNTSTFTPQSGTVTFNGIASQTITNTAGETFYNLTINNSTASGAVVLGGPANVNNTMTFTDGHVVTTSTNLLTFNTGATVASVSDGSHVDGPVAKVKDAATVFTFPVGNGINYMAASVTPTATDLTTYVVEYFGTEQALGNGLDPVLDHISSQDYWTVGRSGIAGAEVTLSWQYASDPDSEISAGSLADLRVAQWDGVSQWINRGNTGTNIITPPAIAGTIKSNTITDFTQPYFVIASITASNPLSNNRYFEPVATTGNWNGAGVWAYRLGGDNIAPEPTSNKNVFIVTGNTATIEDSGGQQTKSMLSLTIDGTLAMNDGAGTGITVNVGTGGMTVGSAGDVTGSDVDDRIRMAGNIVLNNLSPLSHPNLEVDFTTQSHTITGTGSLPFLHINQNNQTFSGTVSFTTLVVGGTATNNGTITVTGALSGGSTLTNGATGIFIWQGTTVAGDVINATTTGNSIQLVNNTGGNINIGLFVTGNTFGNLTLSGANTFIQSTPIDINGNLTINGVFNNSNDLTIGGNWTNNNGPGGFLQGTDDITFDGSSAQSISISTGPPNNEEFANLIINNSSSTGVTIASGEVHVTNGLTLTDGIVFTDATNLLVVENGATSDVGSAASFVDGPMKKIGNTTFEFPVGDGATWARLRMQTVSGYDAATEFTCQYLHSAYSNTTSLDAGFNNVSTVEHWLLDRVSDPGDDAQCLVRLFWQSTAASAIVDLADLRVGHYYNPGSGLKWYSFGGIGTNTGSGTGNIVSTTTFTSFSPITFGSDNGFNPLPVELISFTATLEDKAVVLAWKTASELNNDYFTVERSGDGLRFDSLVMVDGAGTTNVQQSYSTVDGRPYGGLSYYRLKQTDFDGAKSYSKVVAVRRPQSDWSVYPNPSDGITLNFQIPEGQSTKPIRVTITDMRGATVLQNNYNVGDEGEITLTLAEPLKPGAYILFIEDGVNHVVKRLSVVR